jgi:hypothetical protein
VSETEVLESGIHFRPKNAPKVNKGGQKLNTIKWIHQAAMYHGLMGTSSRTVFSTWNTDGVI